MQDRNLPLPCNGIYRVTRDALLSSGPYLDDSDIGSIALDVLVNVVEVLHVRDDQRVRGRIRIGTGGEGWISLRSTDGQKVWAEKVAEELWVADNSLLDADSPGLGYRCSEDIEDRLDEQFVVWGQAVSGSATSDGRWLKVGDLYLPMKLDGQVVLLREKEYAKRTSSWASGSILSMKPLADLAENFGLTEAAPAAAYNEQLAKRLERRKQRSGKRASAGSSATANQSAAPSPSPSYAPSRSAEDDGSVRPSLASAASSGRSDRSPRLQRRLDQRRRRRQSGVSVATSSTHAPSTPGRVPFNGNGALLEVPPAEEDWLAFNGNLQADSPGIGFRRSQSMDDLIEGELVAWGQVVRGRLTPSRAWLKVGNRFLPMRINGARVLRKLEARTSTASAHSEHAFKVLARRQRCRQARAPIAAGPLKQDKGLSAQVGKAVSDWLQLGADAQQQLTSAASFTEFDLGGSAGSLISGLTNMANNFEGPDLSQLNPFGDDDDLPSDAESEEHCVWGSEDNEEDLLARLESCPATRRAAATMKLRRAVRSKSRQKSGQAGTAASSVEGDRASSPAPKPVVTKAHLRAAQPAPEAAEAALLVVPSTPARSRSSSSSSASGAENAVDDDWASTLRGYTAAVLNPVLGDDFFQDEEEHEEHNIWGKNDTEEALRERWGAFQRVERSGAFGTSHARAIARKEDAAAAAAAAAASPKGGAAASCGKVAASQKGIAALGNALRRLSPLPSSDGEGADSGESHGRLAGYPRQKLADNRDAVCGPSTAASTRPSTSCESTSGQRRIVLPSRPPRRPSAGTAGAKASQAAARSRLRAGAAR